MCVNLGQQFRKSFGDAALLHPPSGKLPPGDRAHVAPTDNRPCAGGHGANYNVIDPCSRICLATTRLFRNTDTVTILPVR